MSGPMSAAETNTGRDFSCELPHTASGAVTITFSDMGISPRRGRRTDGLARPPIELRHAHAESCDQLPCRSDAGYGRSRP